MSEEEDESPYCEVCGTCGYIGCCGIRNFIDEHIKGKTNCKNEDIIIDELITLCECEDEAFIENEKLKNILHELEEYIIGYTKSINNPDIYELGISDTLLEVKMKLDELKEKYK